MILGQLVNETGKEKVMAKGLLEEAKQLRSTHFSHLHLTENESDRLSGSTGLYEINKLDATRAEPLRAQNRFSEGPNKDSSKGVANGDEHRANISNVPYGTSYGGDHSPYELG